MPLLRPDTHYMKYFCTINICLLLLLLSPHAFGSSDINSQARTARQRAQHRLQEKRADMMAQRKQQSSQLNRAYRRLANLKKNQQRLHKELQQTLENTQREQKQREKITVLMAQGLNLSQNFNSKDDWPALQEAMRQAVQTQLQDLQNSNTIYIAAQSIITRSGAKKSVDVLHIGAIEQIALGQSAAEQGLLYDNGHGDLWVQGPEIPEKTLQMLRQANTHHPAFLPIDLQQNLNQPTAKLYNSLGSWLSKGGVFSWTILALGLLGLALLTERCLYIRANPIHGFEQKGRAVKSTSPDPHNASCLGIALSRTPAHLRKQKPRR